MFKYISRSYFDHCRLPIETVSVIVANVKRKKSIALSKGESLSLYTREHGALWKSMEVHDWKYQWGSRWRVKTRV